MTDELRATFEAWTRAIEEGDVARAEPLLAPEYALTSEGGVATQVPRDEWLAALSQIDTTSFSVETFDAREFGDVAVVASRATWQAMLGDRDLSGEYALTDVFVRREGRWLVAWRVSTRLPA